VAHCCWGKPLDDYQLVIDDITNIPGVQTPLTSSYLGKTELKILLWGTTK
jgi:hypothetical protein